jgi:hypothetical protein
MPAHAPIPGDWRSRLLALEREIERCESAGEINWHLRIHARILRFLIARYGEPPPRTDPRPMGPLNPHARPQPLDTLPPTGPFAWEEGDAGEIARAAAGAPRTDDAAPELTWWEVCYCLLPWEQTCPPPGSETFEHRPRSPDVLADALRNIHEANTRPRKRRRWFRWSG